MSTRIGRQSFEFTFIRQRIELHPRATAADIAASLELDGIKVSASQVRQVMDLTRHTAAQIADFCYRQNPDELPVSRPLRASARGR